MVSSEQMDWLNQFYDKCEKQIDIRTENFICKTLKMKKKYCVYRKSVVE